MFTGIVEEMGRVRDRDGNTFTFEAPELVSGLAVGDSVAVNGACLTAVEVDLGDGWWRAEAVNETLARTNLDSLSPGDPVNLERPVRAGDRLGGHLVQGHVDGVGTVVDPAPSLVVRAPGELVPYVVEKGSIAVDGCSLTVAAVGDDWFRVFVIPHTADVTTLGLVRPGDRVNLEVDLVAKYVESLLARDGRIADQGA
jgi:riboflavin synthase